MMFYLINKTNSDFRFFTEAYDVAIYMLGKKTSNYIIVKSPSALEPLDKLLLNIPWDITELERVLENL